MVYGPIISGGAGGPASLAGLPWLKGAPKLFNILGGKRNTQDLVAGESFPGYDAQGNDILQDIVDKYQFADFTYPNANNFTQQPQETNSPNFLENIVRNIPNINLGSGTPPYNPNSRANIVDETPSVNTGIVDRILRNLPPIQIGGGNTTVNTPPPKEEGGFDWMQILLPLLTGVAGGLENREGIASSETINEESPYSTSNRFFEAPYTTNAQTIESPYSVTSSSKNIYDPESLALRNQLISKWTGALNQDPDLSGYAANELSDLNRLYGLRSSDIEGENARRGITGPAAINSLRALDSERFGAATRFRNTLPLTARQLREETLGKAGQFFSSLPTDTLNEANYSGRTTSNATYQGGREGTQTTDYTGRTNKTSTKQEQSGNILGGITGGVAEALALLYGLNGRRGA